MRKYLLECECGWQGKEDELIDTGCPLCKKETKIHVVRELKKIKEE